jgi:hypothetical protein
MADPGFVYDSGRNQTDSRRVVFFWLSTLRHFSLPVMAELPVPSSCRSPPINRSDADHSEYASHRPYGGCLERVAVRPFKFGYHCEGYS